MFEDDEWLALVDKLRQLTEDGKAKWELDQDLGDVLTTEIGGGEYEIGSRDADGQPPYYLSVKTGRPPHEVDRLYTDGSVSGWTPTRIPGRELLALRNIAYRMSLGGPQLAKSLLADLFALDPKQPDVPPVAPF